MTTDLVDRPVMLDPLPGATVDPGQARILVFDSGLGGLTVLGEVVEAVPQGELLFAADDAVFPYGGLAEDVLIERVLAVLGELIVRFRPDVVVVACNTASTVVLAPLRARWPDIAFVGTVPAIKPAAALSVSKLISVLATPGTVAREYTRTLVRSFAGDCAVTLVGSRMLASYAEAEMRGDPVDDESLRAELAPVFVTADGKRTDTVVLACTHFPLLLDRFEQLAPWRVAWVDPAPAIARRVHQVLVDRGYRVEPQARKRDSIPATFTSGRTPNVALERFLAGRGIMPLPNAPF